MKNYFEKKKDLDRKKLILTIIILIVILLLAKLIFEKLAKG
jgi:hypothetical protein